MWVCMPVACVYIYIIYNIICVCVKWQLHENHGFWFGYNWHGCEGIFANTKKYHLYHSEYCVKNIY